MPRTAIDHKHPGIIWRTIDFSGCVAPDQCVPEAHGDITDIAKCSCGAAQKTNINREYSEIGPWEETDPAGDECP
jgi:hypothetical protein